MNPTDVPATADLCDPLREPAAAAAAGLRVLPPVFRDHGGVRRFCGPVRTVRCFEDNQAVKAAVASSGVASGPDGPVPCVLVVAGGGSLQRALLGGNLAATAAANGWAGVVLDGAVRDTAELAVCALGIRALGSTPLPCARGAAGASEGERDEPVLLQGVPVAPGEWLCADEDGIVVLPQRPAGAA
jgi:regulator of ribonuclease activity A